MKYKIKKCVCVAVLLTLSSCGSLEYIAPLFVKPTPCLYPRCDRDAELGANYCSYHSERRYWLR